MLVSSPWHCKMCSRFTSKRGGVPKSCVSKFRGARNCASKLRVTILLRDPLTIPGSRDLSRPLIGRSHLLARHSCTRWKPRRENTCTRLTLGLGSLTLGETEVEIGADTRPGQLHGNILDQSVTILPRPDVSNFIVRTFSFFHGFWKFNTN